jgi:hypothetical protein
MLASFQLWTLKPSPHMWGTKYSVLELYLEPIYGILWGFAYNKVLDQHLSCLKILNTSMFCCSRVKFKLMTSRKQESVPPTTSFILAISKHRILNYCVLIFFWKTINQSPCKNHEGCHIDAWTIWVIKGI